MQKSEGRRAEAEARNARKRRLREEAKQASQASPAAPSQHEPEAHKRARLATPRLYSAPGDSVAQEVRPFLMQLCFIAECVYNMLLAMQRMQKLPL